VILPLLTELRILVTQELLLDLLVIFAAVVEVYDQLLFLFFVPEIVD